MKETSILSLRFVLLALVQILLFPPPILIIEATVAKNTKALDGLDVRVLLHSKTFECRRGCDKSAATASIFFAFLANFLTAT
jgi:hypothetical protein